MSENNNEELITLELIPEDGLSKYDPEAKALNYKNSNDGKNLMLRMRAALQQLDEEDEEQNTDNIYEKIALKIDNANTKKELIDARIEIQKLPATKERNVLIKKYNSKVQEWTLKK